MNITVYLGAQTGNDDKFRAGIEELGTYIGKSGNTLVYGGSKIGLMGLLADSTLAAGGRVIGVEPQMFIDRGYQHRSLSELIITKDLPERKANMRELGDAFIAFPGGTGTLEEISEIISLIALDLLEAPCIIFDLDGFYDGLKELLNTMISYEFSTESRQKGIYFVKNISELDEILASI